MNKHHFDKIEFYITNVCNLNCDNCNRFNNHSFSGWQRWSDYKATYEQWSQYIDIHHLVLLGGEPLLNPEVIQWVRGLNSVFKKSVQILSNGTRINHVPDLYKTLSVNGNWLGITWHNPNTLDEFENQIKKFMKGRVDRLDPADPRNKFKDAQVVWIDSNNMCIPLWIQYDFYQSAIQASPDEGLTLHNSDPAKAHEVCGFAQAKNYHFIKGKLYKCGPVALFPEFDNQHRLNISPQDRDLINSYQPLTVEQCVLGGSEYFANLDMPLAQCKFCPETLPLTSRLFSVPKNQAKKQISIQLNQN